MVRGRLKAISPEDRGCYGFSYIRSGITDSVFGRIIRIFVIPGSVCSKYPRVGEHESHAL